MEAEIGMGTPGLSLLSRAREGTMLPPLEAALAASVMIVVVVVVLVLSSLKRSAEAAEAAEAVPALDVALTLLLYFLSLDGEA